MSPITPPIATAQMLIRKPVSEVFNAFIDPAITVNFWFTKGSGKLEAGKTVQWTWEMYGFSVNVVVKAIEKDKRILIDWSAIGEKPTEVEWLFTARDKDKTFVQIINKDFPGTAHEQAKQAIDSAGGFAFVLAGLKAWIEHGININLIADHA